MDIIIKKLSKDAKIPTKATKGASGYDVYSLDQVTLKPMERKLIHTGLSLEIPLSYEVQIRPRSGLALKKGVTVLNSPGTIDSDYRGEVGVILINLGDKPVEILKYDRVAQMVIQKVDSVNFIEGDIDSTERGAGGFGHTGLSKDINS